MQGYQETQAGLEQQQERERKLADKRMIQEIRELFSALDEACPVIRSLLENNQKMQAVELLATMQELVITLGNKIEQVYGETEDTAAIISVLEQCCENIWQCSNAKGAEALLLFNEVEQGLRKAEDLCLHL